MKFVYLGYDVSVDALLKIIESGHELVGIISYKADGTFTFHSVLEQLAQKYQIPFITKPIDTNILESFVQNGCECFVSVGYPRKIPNINFDKAYGINLHPSYLPQGRGGMPLPKILAEKPEFAGITIHKITPEYDQGDILYQEKIETGQQDDTDTLTAKIIMRSGAALIRVMNDIDYYWKNAKRQSEESSYWSFNKKEQTFEWDKPAIDVNQKIRIFGRFGIFANVEKELYQVTEAKAWEEKHDYKPGEMVLRLNQKIVLAIKDGFVILKQLYPLR